MTTRMAKSYFVPRLTTVLSKKTLLRRSPIGIISFTFDDFPRSAFTVGGRILNRYGMAGTYYVAGGLTDTQENGVPCHALSDIKNAIESGHEIGSHGYAHLRYSNLLSAEIEADLAKNEQFLANISGGARPKSFSYPFGALKLRTKRQLSSHFTTLRGIYPGINGKSADLGCLRANSIYSCRTNEREIQQLIKKTAITHGWLIFYTHDVSDNPTAWGATPSLLEFAIREAVASGCRILPIREAIENELTYNPIST